MYSLEFALSLANYIYLSILLKASPGQRDAGLFLYLIKETRSGERSVKYQGGSGSDTPAPCRGLEGDVAEGSMGERSSHLHVARLQAQAGGGESQGRRSCERFGLRPS